MPASTERHAGIQLQNQVFGFWFIELPARLDDKALADAQRLKVLAPCIRPVFVFRISEGYSITNRREAELFKSIQMILQCTQAAGQLIGHGQAALDGNR